MIRDHSFHRLRFALGMAQIAGAGIGFALLITTGVSRATLFAVALTTLLTAISILLGHLRMRRS